MLPWLVKISKYVLNITYVITVIEAVNGILLIYNYLSMETRQQNVYCISPKMSSSIAQNGKEQILQHFRVPNCLSIYIIYNAKHVIVYIYFIINTGINIWLLTYINNVTGNGVLQLIRPRSFLTHNKPYFRTNCSFRD